MHGDVLKHLSQTAQKACYTLLALGLALSFMLGIMQWRIIFGTNTWIRVAFALFCMDSLVGNKLI
ncbi:hypothetical protein [Helicobacter cynogastricus]|uniref:hypothetical protein n=1 Tax=Helicobacter cynogastricus TaxID=329937 RepID=UPI000CF02AF7|nr:hypothetical protein [Helicobacter cynogastricus]